MKRVAKRKVKAASRLLDQQAMPRIEEERWQQQKEKVNK